MGPILTVLLILLPINSVWSFSPDADLTARAAVIMDAATGKILYQKDSDLPLPPASTTKVVTAILALESGRKLTESFTVSKAATRVPATKLYLRPGQTITIEDLLYGILLSSANDASMVLAEGIGGSVERYTELMTKKAHAIGALNSNFTNPHGLTAPDHYSTARDLAILFRYAMKNATGYTHAAQKCFVGAVVRNGVTLIVSILGARDQWGDTKKLLEYGFDNYQTLETQPAGKTSMSERVSVRPEHISASIVTPQEDIKSKPSDAYLLQVGSFRERDRAESLVKQFSADGFEAFVETISLTGGQTTYRVRVGPYAELLEAQEIAQEILDKNGLRVLILPAPAVQPTADNPS